MRRCQSAATPRDILVSLEIFQLARKVRETSAHHVPVDDERAGTDDACDESRVAPQYNTGSGFE